MVVSITRNKIKQWQKNEKCCIQFLYNFKPFVYNIFLFYSVDSE